MFHSSTGSTTIRHSFLVRSIPITAAIVAVMMGGVSLVGLWDIVVQISAGDPNFSGVLLVPRLITYAGIGPLMVMIFVQKMRSNWFFLNEYTLRDSVLEAFDPILRKRTVLSLCSVRKIGSFVVFGPRFGTLATRGHVLHAADGASQEIRVSEALPIWPDILRECEDVSPDPMPRPWWEVRCE